MEQPVNAEPDQSRFSLKRLFNWLAERLPLTRLFNAFARPSGPRPTPISIDPTWFPVPESEWEAEDELHYVSVLPDEPVPLDAGELLRTYYAPGIGDVRVYAWLDPDEMDIDPGQIIELDEWDDELAPENMPKPSK